MWGVYSAAEKLRVLSCAAAGTKKEEREDFHPTILGMLVSRLEGSLKLAARESASVWERGKVVFNNSSFMKVII